MRILVHDYSGHPFQVQLSRQLARLGHEVLHLHCPSFTTGKGALDRSHDDPPSFSVSGVDLGAVFEKYSLTRRYGQERRYGRMLIARAAAFRPDVVLSSNTPLFTQQRFIAWCRRAGVPFVFWQQDIYSVAMSAIARGRAPLIGAAAGSVFRRIERRMLRESAAVVSISEDFLPVLRHWGIPEERLHVIENWAPLDELPLRSRRNPWSAEHGLDDKIVLLYSRTLGLKHNPDLLLRLALHWRHRPDVAVVVNSEGPGADWLRSRVIEHRLTNLRVLGFQPYERMPEVLATGDVLVVILNNDAGVFSVPSKVLSYQCAARPLLAAVPSDNLAARLIVRSGSGILVRPDDPDAFVGGSERLVENPALRAALGKNARRHAVEAFDIAAVGNRFEFLLRGATLVAGSRTSPQLIEVPHAPR